MNTEVTEITLVEQDEPQAPETRELAIAEHSPAGMMMAAMSRGASLEQVEKMMELQERWEANEARKAYNAAMAQFKAEAIEVIKRKQVDFPTKAGGRTNYKHAELSDVMEAVGPALSKHGFAWSYKTEQKPGWVTVTCILTHAKGHSEAVTLGGPPDDSGGKNAIQQIASTVTYLERHTLKAACGVAEKGDDNDGAGGAAAANDWLAKVEEAATEDELRATSKEGAAHFTKTKDVPGYAAFMKAVQKRGAAIKEKARA